MKKTTLIQCPLAFCLAVAFGVSALTAAAETPSDSYVRSRIKDYAAQDARALESDKLAAAGKYEQAIQILKEEILDVLKLELDNVDSWRAKQRYAEFSAKLRKLQNKYGSIKLREAETAYSEGRYADAIKAASEAKNVCDELTDDANEISAAAQSRKSASDFRDKINPEKMDKNLVSREKQVKAALAAARTLIDNGKYEAASQEIEKVYVLDPFNADAANMATELYKAYYTIGRKRRDADMAGMMSREAWQWVEPLFPRESANEDKEVASIVKTADDHGIQAKLDKIIFPKVQFEAADIYAVIDFINKRSKSYDTVNGTGVLVDIDSSSKDEEPKKEVSEGSEGEPDPEAANPRNRRMQQRNSAKEEVESAPEAMVSLDVKNVSLRELLNYVCYLTGMTYSVLEDRVVMGAVGVSRSQSYDIAPSLIRLIDNYDKGIDKAATAKKSEDDDEEGGSSSGSQTMASLSPEALKKFFTLYGVNFPEDSSVSCRNTTLTMKNTDANHRKMSELLRELNEDKPMVQIEVKSIELTESDMEELGFNWALEEVSDINLDSKRTASNAGMGNYNNKGITFGSNTRYDSDGGSARALTMLGNLLSGVDSRIISKLNIFPDLLGSFHPFGGDKQLSLSLTINALDRSDRTEMVSAPKVLVRSGETAEVQMGKSYFFPTDWDELEVEIEDSDGDNGYSYTLTLPTPSFPDEPELMGTNFKVTPRVLTDGKTIRLDINPVIKSYVGKDEYYMDVLVYRDGKLSEAESQRNLAIWRPIIATRSLDLQVDVYHGETLVLGGLSDSISQSRLDKIPILGDIPFIGRLFQSHSEVSTRRNTLVFVTAKLMDSSGVPIRKTQSNFGIPEMGR